MASRSVPTGTRVSVFPVRVMPLTAPISRWIGCEHPARDQDPARQPDEDDGDRHERDDGAEPRQQLLAALGALADLEERAVGELRRRDFEPRGARARLRLLPRARCARRARLTSKSLHSGGMLTKSVSLPPRTTRTNSRSCRPDRCSMSTARASAGRPPSAYRARVLPQRRGDDLPVALGERGGEQRVGQQHDGERARHEDAPRTRTPGAAESSGWRGGGEAGFVGHCLRRLAGLVACHKTTVAKLFTARPGCRALWPQAHAR